MPNVIPAGVSKELYAADTCPTFCSLISPNCVMYATAMWPANASKLKKESSCVFFMNRFDYPDKKQCHKDAAYFLISNCKKRSQDPNLSSSFAFQVFIMYDLAHRFCIDLAFDPRDNIKVSKGPCFKAVFFKVLDLPEKCFQFGF